MNPMEKRHLFIKSICIWLPFAAVVTTLCGLAYLLVQQDIRSSANYPQTVLAEDATTLSAPVNIATSLAPFVDVFDLNGKVVQSNAVLDGSGLVPPPGVFDYTRTHGEDSFTWQPEAGIRIAAVIVYHPGNTKAEFVLAGRSLRDVEILESRLATDTFLVWISTLLATFFFSCLLAKVLSPRPYPLKVEKPEVTAQTQRGQSNTATANIMTATETANTANKAGEVGKTDRVEKVAPGKISDSLKSIPVPPKPAATQNKNILNNPNFPTVEKSLNTLSPGDPNFPHNHA